MPRHSPIKGSSTIRVTAPEGRLTVLSISPIDADHLSLEASIDRSTWKLSKAHDLVSALPFLEQHNLGVVICERNLPPGTWIDVLEHIKTLPITPSLIVTDRLADERLWVEALNLGAWDVMAKPFDRGEVIRCVESGWRHWFDRIQIPAA